MQVTAILEDGRRFEGDLLVGADGIWSKVMRSVHLLVGNKAQKTKET
jgi:2-polyprenyl-6-methoxyphenol hydroxylase-like FAD-dependent oxidoreductase